ncbi:MAG: 50S ribosomal protein L29 [Candidatus Levybacteria bacterium]|nr:50S ribosomal protein L29 [Candidatus Levybacteria bacterium]
MKTKEKKELHLKNLEELKRQVSELKEALVNLKLEKSQNKLKNTSQLSLTRKKIAQILTIMRAKELSLSQNKKK